MDDQSDVEVLGRTELFRGAPLDLLAEVQRASFRKRFAAGEAIVRQGDPPATVYVVVVGRLRVTQTTLDGQQVIIRYLGPGEVVILAAPKASSRSFDASRLQAYYAARGIASDLDVVPDSGDAGPLLLHAAQKAGANLIVAGAFGHPRLQEFIFGGTTRTLLAADQPSLFLSH